MCTSCMLITILIVKINKKNGKQLVAFTSGMIALYQSVISPNKCEE